MSPIRKHNNLVWFGAVGQMQEYEKRHIAEHIANGECNATAACTSRYENVVAQHNSWLGTHTPAAYNDGGRRGRGWVRGLWRCSLHRGLLQPSPTCARVLGNRFKFKNRRTQRARPCTLRSTRYDPKRLLRCCISHSENGTLPHRTVRFKTLHGRRKVENRINNAKMAASFGVSAEVRNTLAVPFSIGRCSCVDIKQSTWTTPWLLVSFFSAGGSLSVPF